MSTGRSRTERTAAYLARVRAERKTLLDALHDPVGVQRATLAEIVEGGRGTAFGDEHGLADVRDATDYRRAVPIRGHEEFEPWSRRVAAGEASVLTHEEPIAFFASSGTTGAEKKIPVTLGFLRRCFLPFYFAGLARLAEHDDDLVSRDDAVLNLWQDPHSKVARTEGGQPHIGPSQLDYGSVGEDLAVGLGNRAPWSALPDDFADAGPWERTYLRVRLAAEHDVRAVFAVNPAIAAMLPHQLNEWWPRMVKEIRDGTLGGRPFRPGNPRRAEELGEVARRTGTLRPADVWPRLGALFLWPTYVARLYLPDLLAEYGTETRILPAPVGSSEGPLAIPAEGHPTGGPLMTTSCFYEFVPAERDIDPSGPTLLAHELEAGREYHVVLSHVGGLYRCSTRDIVRVLGLAGATPAVEYSCRGGVLSQAGERLRESQVLRAAGAAARTAGVAVANLTVRPVLRTGAAPGTPGYEAAVAFRGGPDADRTAEFGRAFDAALGQESAGYARARSGGALEPLRLREVPFARFFDEFRRRVEAGERPPRVKDRVFASPDGWARVTGDNREEVSGE